MLVVQLVYQQLENYVVYPIVYRKAVSLSPFTTIAAVLDRRVAARGRRRDPGRAVRRGDQDRGARSHPAARRAHGRTAWRAARPRTLPRRLTHMEPTLAGRLAEYRTMRREMEASVLPLATSVDGRRFTFQAPLEPLALRIGGYVVLESPGGRRLGQVLSLGVVSTDAGEIGWEGASTHMTLRLARGDGVILDGPRDPFHDAAVRPAEPEDVRAWLHAAAPRRAVLPAGELTTASGLVHALDAGGFDRHTFLCGQSGSGKTYALGVLLERLLLSTSLRIVVLDPNSDYVRLTELRGDAAPELVDRYTAAAAGVVVHRAGGTPRLRLRLGELGESLQAAVLRLDPIADRDEYAELNMLLADLRPETLAELHASDRPSAAALSPARAQPRRRLLGRVGAR